MSSSTANKIVLAFVFGGVFLALYNKDDGATRYRHVWGLVLLGAGASILADFIPQLVGPFLGLVAFAYLTGHVSFLSGKSKEIQQQAGVKKNA